MLGFKQFDNAAVTISGIELAEKIKNGQLLEFAPEPPRASCSGKNKFSALSAANPVIAALRDWRKRLEGRSRQGCEF
jgi:hypothetical protein